jgi:signal transduction histidine kinase
MIRWVHPSMPADESARLETLRDYDILDTPAEPAFDDLTWLATHICGTPIATITLIDAGRQWFKSHIGMKKPETPRNESFCAFAILQPDQIFEVPDAAEDDRFADNPGVTGDPDIRFYAGAPLVVENGQALGTLCVIDRVPRQLTDAQRRSLEALAAQAVSQLELRRRLRAVRDQRSRLITSIDAVPSALIIRDKSGRVVLQNQAAGRFSGAKGWEAVTVLRKDGSVLPREEWPGVRALAGQRVDAEQLVLRAIDGTTTPVYATSAPILDSRDAVAGAVTSFTDITSLAEVARLKDEFVATVSHELRTPLTAIKGSLQLLQTDPSLDPGHVELIGVALGNADRLIRMVSDILDAAKIEAGALKLQRRTLAVAALAATAVENVRPIAAAAGVRLAVDVAPGVRAVHVDVDRMVQAIVNLLSNAVKFAPRASTVTLAARAMEDGGVSMTVHDEGSGIPPERLHRLFEKFSQLEPGSTNQGKGTGLGLAITKSLVEEHGGTVHVDSGRGAGTTFEIRLYGDGTAFAQAAAPNC